MRQNCIFLGEGLLSYADQWAYLASLKRIPKAGGMKQSARFEAILVDGSFVTGKLAPNDVDILAVLRPGHDFERDLPISEYALVSRAMLRRRFAFDVDPSASS